MLDDRRFAFMEQFEPPCYKAASASLTDDALLARWRRRRTADHLDGMWTMDEIDAAVTRSAAIGCWSRTRRRRTRAVEAINLK